MISGVVESFSANFYCRFGETHRDICRKLTDTSAVPFRNKVSYDSHLLVNDEKLFSMEVVNGILNHYPFHLKSFNKPGLLNEKDLKQGKIRMSASEMLHFFETLSFLVGNFIPDENNYWELYLLLREIFYITTKNKLMAIEIDKLRHLIKSHHNLYLSLSDGNSLKPKHHLITHYPEIILKVSPLIHFWTIQNEAKHRTFKRISNSI